MKTLNTISSKVGPEKFFSEFNSFRSFLPKSDYDQQKAYASKIGMENYLFLLYFNRLATEFDKGDLKGRLNQVLIRGGEATVVMLSNSATATRKIEEIGRQGYGITCENGVWKL